MYTYSCTEYKVSWDYKKQKKGERLANGEHVNSQSFACDTVGIMMACPKNTMDDRATVQQASGIPADRIESDSWADPD